MSTKRLGLERYITLGREAQKRPGKVDILFITPIASDAFRIPSSTDTLNYGVATVANIIVQHDGLQDLRLGHFSELQYQERKFTPAEIWQIIQRSGATMVAWSFVSADVPRLQEVMRYIEQQPEQQRKGITFIGGGPGARDYDYILKTTPLLRALVIGPGNEAGEVVRRIQTGASLADMARVAWKDDQDIIHEPPSTTSTVNYNLIPPPDWHLVTLGGDTKTIEVPIQIRGNTCSEKCAFCGARDKHVRSIPRAVTTVLPLLDVFTTGHVLALDVKDNNADPQHPAIRRLIETIAARRTDQITPMTIGLATSARTVAAIDPSLGEMLASVTEGIFIGIEHTSTRVAHYMKLGKTDPVTFNRALEVSQRHSLHLTLSFVAGYEIEGEMVPLAHDLVSIQRVLVPIHRALKRNPNSVNTVVFYPYIVIPDSLDWQRALDQGENREYLYQKLQASAAPGKGVILKSTSSLEELETDLISILLQARYRLANPQATRAWVESPDFDREYQQARRAYTIIYLNDLLQSLYATTQELLPDLRSPLDKQITLEALLFPTRAQIAIPPEIREFINEYLRSNQISPSKQSELLAIQAKGLIGFAHLVPFLLLQQALLRLARPTEQYLEPDTGLIFFKEQLGCLIKASVQVCDELGIAGYDWADLSPVNAQHLAQRIQTMQPYLSYEQQDVLNALARMAYIQSVLPQGSLIPRTATALGVSEADYQKYRALKQVSISFENTW